MLWLRENHRPFVYFIHRPMEILSLYSQSRRYAYHIRCPDTIVKIYRYNGNDYQAFNKDLTAVQPEPLSTIRIDLHDPNLFVKISGEIDDTVS